MYHVILTQFRVGMIFLGENVGHRGRIPKIIYPINNTIEVQLGK